MAARPMFTEDQVRELHEEVLRIVGELKPPPELLVEVYRSVVSMAGQHQITQPAVGIPIGPNGLPI